MARKLAAVGQNQGRPETQDRKKEKEEKVELGTRPLWKIFSYWLFLLQPAAPQNYFKLCCLFSLPSAPALRLDLEIM
jgi:hypothetical protein